MGTRRPDNNCHEHTLACPHFTHTWRTSQSSRGTEVAHSHQCFAELWRLPHSSGETAFDYGSIGRGFKSLRAHRNSGSDQEFCETAESGLGLSLGPIWANIDDSDHIVPDHLVGARSARARPRPVGRAPWRIPIAGTLCRPFHPHRRAPRGLRRSLTRPPASVDRWMGKSVFRPVVRVGA